jgi:drug/metabolite transporter (DMT)-like permease
MCVALAGSLTVIVSPLFLGNQAFGLGQFEGNLLILASTITDIFAILLLKKSMKRLSPLFVTLVMFALTALFFYPLALYELQTWSLSQLDYRGVIGIVFGALLSSTLAYYLHDYGISKMKAEEVGIFTYIAPIITIIVAVPLLGEIPNEYFYLGGALVIIGILIARHKLHWHALHELKRQK